MNILVIEDEPKVARAIRQGLEAEGYQITAAATGEEGYFLATTHAFDLTVLDLMLPGRSGLEILHAIRQQRCAARVLILTARDTVEDRVLGLDAGADDYLVKPFAFPELFARIRALTRRGRPEQALRLRLADLELDCVTRKVTRGSREIELTGREFGLLEYLLRYQGHAVSREMLARGDSDKAKLIPCALDLSALVGEVVDELGVLAEEKSQVLSTAFQPWLRPTVDRATLRQAISNVLHNAIQHTPREGRIEIRTVKIGSGQVAIDIIDNGPGIPESERARVFERFYRLDKARSRKAGGFGLGLAIAQWAVELNGGTIGFHDKEGSGAWRRIVLPGASSERHPF